MFEDNNNNNQLSEPSHGLALWTLCLRQPTDVLKDRKMYYFLSEFSAKIRKLW